MCRRRRAPVMRPDVTRRKITAITVRHSTAASPLRPRRVCFFFLLFSLFIFFPFCVIRLEIEKDEKRERAKKKGKTFSPVCYIVRATTFRLSVIERQPHSPEHPARRFTAAFKTHAAVRFARIVRQRKRIKRSPPPSSSFRLYRRNRQEKKKNLSTQCVP